MLDPENRLTRGGMVSFNFSFFCGGGEGTVDDVTMQFINPPFLSFSLT